MYFIDFKGIKVSKFYSESGVSYGILTQKSKIAEDNIVKFLTKYPEVNSEWLLTGKGEMLKSTGTNVASGDHAIAGHNNAVINMGKEAQDQELETLRQENIELRITIAAKDAEIRTLRDMIALLAPKP